MKKEVAKLKGKEKALDKLDGIKKLVMDAYRATKGNVTSSCSVVGMGRATWYYWLDKTSEGFDADFALAKQEADEELNDDIRDVLIEKAGDGDMTAVIFYLKSRHPDFKPQPLVQNYNQTNNYNQVASEQKDKYGIE